MKRKALPKTKGKAVIALEKVKISKPFLGRWSDLAPRQPSGSGEFRGIPQGNGWVLGQLGGGIQEVFVLPEGFLPIATAVILPYQLPVGWELT